MTKKKRKSSRTTIPEKLSGKQLVFAGKFPDQQGLEELIVAEGGRIPGKLSADIDFLIVGATRGGGPSGVEKEAQKLNQRGATIQIVDESNFLALLAPTRVELLALLQFRAGLERIQKYRRLGGAWLPSLAGADLRGWKAEWNDPCQVSLQGLNFDGADMRKATISDVSLGAIRKVNLDGATVTASGFDSLIESTARNSRLNGLYIHGALTGSDFSGSTIAEAPLDYNDAAGAIFRKCRFQAGEFENAILTGADLSGARLAGAKMAGSHLEGANLDKADLSRADLRNATLVRANLKGADLRGADLRQADLTGACLDGARFDGADVAAAKITKAQIGKARGIASEASQTPAKAGPHLKQLGGIVKKAEFFWTEATIRLPDKEVVAHACFNRYGKASSSVSRREYNSLTPALLETGVYYHHGVLDIDSIKVRLDKGPITNRELKPLAVAAWCEAFAVDYPTKESTKTRRQTRAAEQETIREAMLADLLKGPKGLKRWSERHDKLRPSERDFRGVQLAGAKIAGINLEKLNLQGSDFTNADLSGARLVDCDLRKACFKGARLDKAIAWNAKLADADLTGAHVRQAQLPHNCLRVIFRDAELTNAELNYSNLSGADFTGATLTGTKFDQAKYDESTRWPDGFTLPADLRWVGKGENPAIAQAMTKLQTAGPVDLPTFLERLKQRVDEAKYEKALDMLKADRFKLFAQVESDSVIGVVKSQTDPDLVYSCRLAGDGKFACCTQNLNICGGLRGSLCKHLLVLIVGLANSGELDPTAVDIWVEASRLRKPELEKDRMSEAFLRYKGAEAGEVDWRPTETIPEDYYAL